MERDLIEKLGKFVLSEEESGGVRLEETGISESLDACCRSLFGKLYGVRRANFTGLKKEMEKGWKLPDKFEVKELGPNCYQFIFFSPLDKEKVLGKIHRVLDNQYLLLKEWSEDIVSSLDSLHTMDMWVHVWNVPSLDANSNRM